MKKTVRRLQRLTRYKGDTLIEVMFSIAAITVVLLGAFILSQRSTSGIQTGQERSELTQIMQSQVELVRSIAMAQTDDTTGVYKTTPKYFCIDPVTRTRVDFGPTLAALPPAESDDFTQYPVACRDIGGRYNLAVTYVASTKTFQFSGRWDRLGGSRNSTELAYRILPGSPVATVGSVCSTNNDIALVLDASHSMSKLWGSVTRIQKLKTVSQTFVSNSEFGPARNHGSIIKFDGTAATLQTFTGDVSQLQGAVGSIPTDPAVLVTATHYLAALDAAKAQFTSSDARPGANKVIIFISDGVPTLPDTPATSQAVTDDMKANGYTIYTIAVNGDAAAQALLSSMASPGGFAPADIDAQLDSIMAGLSNAFSCH